MRLLPDENKNKRKKIVGNEWERIEKEEKQDRRKSSLLGRKTNTLRRMSSRWRTKKMRVFNTRSGLFSLPFHSQDDAYLIDKIYSSK